MADIKWIKITTDIFSDEKILLIEQLPDADTIIVIWFKLLCMAGRDNNNGIFIMNNRMPYTEEMLATLFRRPLNTVRLALATFEAYGMIDIVDDVFTIPNWEKHQNIDGLDKIREQNRIRKQRQREKQKQALLESSHVTVTSCHATDKDKDKDKEELPKGNSKATKHKYGEFKHVLLTDSEFEKLVNDFGNDIANKAIKFLDEYIEEKGYKSKSHNLAIRRWVIDAVKEQEAKAQRKSGSYQKQTKAEELDEFYKMASEWGQT